MLLDGDEDLTGHMSALLGSWGLILDVDTSSTLLNKELGELHGGGEAAMASVGVSNNGSHIIGGRSRGEFCLRKTSASFPLFPVVEELGGEQVLDLVWDGIIGVV